MDIHRMIRKGSVQFEPGDRIPLTFRNKGKEMTLYLGSVYFDNNLFRVCYDLYNHQNSSIPVGALNPREIDKLTAGDLVSVANRLSEYEKESVVRYSNYESIEKELKDSEKNVIEFDNMTRPRVLINPDLKMEDENAGYQECRVTRLFVAEKECFVSVQNQEGEIKNYKLAMLNDRSIMNISSCLKNRELENKVTNRLHEKNSIPKGVKL